MLHVFLFFFPQWVLEPCIYTDCGWISVSVCATNSSSDLPGHSRLEKLTQLVILCPADTQHINILTLHLPQDDYKAYLSITGR